MTKEFVTLSREVLEQAIEALFCTDSEEGSTAYKNELKAVKKLRAALNQPQAEQPALTPIAQCKLEDLVAEGYTISGYSIYHEQKHQHGFVTGAGLVGWWRPDGVEHPQPQGEQEPVALLADAIRSEPTELIHKWRVLELIQDHVKQQPKREPLTNEQVKAGLIHSIEYTDARERCAFNIGARFAERAHGIK